MMHVEPIVNNSNNNILKIIKILRNSNKYEKDILY